LTYSKRDRRDELAILGIAMIEIGSVESAA
jgi:hypothetical protein